MDASPLVFDPSENPFFIEYDWDIGLDDPDTPAKSTRHKWFARIQGGLVEFTMKRGTPKKVTPHKPGKVGAWSHASRMRMLRYVNTIDWSGFAGSIMATVTYPPDYTEKKYRERTKQRSRLLREVEKIKDRWVATIWKQEFKRRQSGSDKGEIVPHFHYLMPGVTYLNQWHFRDAWRSIVHKDGDLATDVTLIGPGNRGARYISKYICKTDTLDIESFLNNGGEIGRHWGPTRRNLMPLAPVLMNRELDRSEEDFVRQHAVDSWPDRPYVGNVGFTVFGEDCAKFFLNKFGQNVLTSEV